MEESKHEGRKIETDTLQVTQAAQEKIIELIRNAGEDADSVRVFISGGGCSGMNYGMTFADSSETRDSVLEGEEGFRMVIDPFALAYMQDAQIDYSEDDLNNSSFIFNNATPSDCPLREL